MSTRLLVITLIISVSLCSSCGYVVQNIGFGPPEREIEKLYKRADAMYNGILEGRIVSSRQNWIKVIQQFNEIVRAYPKSRFADEAQFCLSSCYIWAYGLLNDSPSKAIEAFEYLIKHYPKSEFVDDAYYWKAYAYSLKKDYKRAIQEYERFIHLYPQSELYKEAMLRIEDLKKNQETAKATVEKPLRAADQQLNKQKALVIPKEVPKTQKLQREPETKYTYVKNIRFHSASEFTRIVMDLSGPVKYETARLEHPDRIYVDLQMTIIAPAKQAVQVNDGVIENIRASQFNENTTRMVLNVKKIGSYKVFHLKEPDRLVVDVYGHNAPQATSPKIAPPDSTRFTPLVKQLGLKVKTIVIDPGHGGKDPGAVSESGVLEKSLVLDVSLRLKKLLEDKETYNVYLTRESDMFIPLENRTAFANQKAADIFMSLHINSCKKPEARGIETYYLSMASDDEARATAALENASSEKTINDLNSIIRDILRGAKVEESRELARTAQSRLCHHTQAPDRGVKRAPFIVLIGANAPSILAELGFMSNKQDENLLSSREYIDKIVQALMEAIEAYVKTIDQRPFSLDSGR